MIDEGALDRLFELEPEPDPVPCKCKPKWLIAKPSPEPTLYQQWECSHCGNRVIRGFPHMYVVPPEG